MTFHVLNVSDSSLWQIMHYVFSIRRTGRYLQACLVFGRRCDHTHVFYKCFFSLPDAHLQDLNPTIKGRPILFIGIQLTSL